MHCRGSIGRIYGHCGCSIGLVCVVLLFWWRQRGDDGSGKRGRWIIVRELVKELVPVFASDGLEVMFVGVKVGMFVAYDEGRVGGEGEHFVRHHPIVTTAWGRVAVSIWSSTRSAASLAMRAACSISACFRVAIGIASRCSIAFTVSSVTWHWRQISR